MNSPFRYAGGKHYARKMIMDYIPNHSMYIEPFVGGGSIFFGKEKAKENWLNDLDEELINVYNILQNSLNELIDCLKGEIPSKERHNYYKNIFKPASDLERAKRWYFLNRTSYSGIMNMQNCYFGYSDKHSCKPQDWGNKILESSKKLQDVKITSLDFRDLFDSLLPNDECFVFIDPPYFKAAQNKLYTKSFVYNCHIDLCEKLKNNSHKFKFLLTYDDCPEIREMYSWVNNIVDKQWYYTIKQSKYKESNTRDKGNELFIMNY